MNPMFQFHSKITTSTWVQIISIQFVDKNTFVSYIVEKATNRDFIDITRLLDPDDLQELFYELDIKKHYSDREEKSADSTDPGIKAKEVLISWRKREAKNATCQALLDALERCRNIEAKETLEDMWNGNSKILGNYVSFINCYYILVNSRVLIGCNTNKYHTANLLFCQSPTRHSDYMVTRQ